MIPELTELGLLPPGVHQATLDEVIARFGIGNEQREAQADSLRWLLPICQRAGITRMLINGSFVTNYPEPNDVDCVLLIGPDFQPDSIATVELEQGIPFLELKIVEEEAYNEFATLIFGMDRRGVSKGVIEVML